MIDTQVYQLPDSRGARYTSDGFGISSLVGSSTLGETRGLDLSSDRDISQMYVSQQRNMYPSGFGYGNHPGYTIPAPEPTIQTSQSCFYNSARYNFNNYARTPPQSFPNSCSYSLPSAPNQRPPPQNCNVNIYNEPHQTSYPSRQPEVLNHIPRHPARDLLPELEDKPISPISEGKLENCISLTTSRVRHRNSS